MGFSYDKLRGRIREVYQTQEAFAKDLGMSRSTLNLKLNNAYEFSQGEMFKALELLRLPKSEIDVYFFTPKVR